MREPTVTNATESQVDLVPRADGFWTSTVAGGGQRAECNFFRELDGSGRTIGIKVRLDDFTTVTRARTLPEPTADAATVTEVALRLLADYAPPRPVRLLGVRVAGLTGAGEPGQLAASRGADSARGPHGARALAVTEALDAAQLALPV